MSQKAQRPLDTSFDLLSDTQEPKTPIQVSSSSSSPATELKTDMITMENSAAETLEKANLVAKTKAKTLKVRIFFQ